MSTVPGASERPVGEVPSPDPSLLALVAPELEEAASIIIDDKTFGPFSRRLDEERADPGRASGRKGIQKFNEAGVIFMDGTVALVLEQAGPEASDQEAFVKDLLKPFEEVDHPAVAIWTLGVLVQAEAVQKLDDLAAGVTSRIKDATEANTTDRYQLMRLLAKSPLSSKTNPQDRAIQALQNLSSFENRKGKRHDILADVTEGLETGAFDSLLAEDMLGEAIAESGAGGSKDQNKQELAALVKFIAPLTGGDKYDAIAWLSTKENLPTWPPAFKQIFDTYKSEQLRTLGANHAAGLESLNKHHYILPENVSPSAVRRQIGQTATRLWRTTANSPGRHSNLRGRARMATLLGDQRVKRQRAQMASRGPRRRRHSGNDEQSSSTETTDPAADPEGAKKPKQRDIVYIAPGNQEVPAGSEAYEELISNYARKHDSGTGLAEDIRSMLSYLRTVDLSQGGVPGVGVVGRNLNIGGRSITRLRMLEPYKAKGLSTSSPQADQVCVMFELLEGGTKIGVVDILHDHEIRAFGRSHNINGLKSRRQNRARHS